MNRYRYLTPVEIIEYLCQGSANGFRKVFLDRLEKRLGLFLPAVLRDFLLRAGRERVCIGEKEFFTPDSFRKKEGYLVIGKIDGAGLTGILLGDMGKDNSPVYIRNIWGRWDVLAESIEEYLLVELDRRIRRTKIARYRNHNDYEEHLSRYFYSEYLLCRELSSSIERSEVFFPAEKWDDIFPGEEDQEDNGYREEGGKDPEDRGGWGEGWEDEEDLEDDGDWEDEEAPEDDGDWEDEEDPEDDDECEDCTEPVIIPQELKDFLFEHKVSYTAASYCIAICQEEETGVLYSACFPKDDQRFVSLLQVNEPCASDEARCVERLLNKLAEQIHDPVMARCYMNIFTLPERVRRLADEELHTWLANTIGNFLDIFEKNRSWKLGIRESGRFVKCSGLKERYEPEALPTLWYGHHLKEDPRFWTPAYRRGVKEEREAAPKELEPFLKELIYRGHDYNLLNRYAFLARKITTNEGYSKRTENYTEEERFALLSFYRQIADGVMERIFDCLERQVFSVQVGGKDFVKLCSNPLAHLEGWMNQYERKDLAFLEEGIWK